MNGELIRIASDLVCDGRGLLSLDESSVTMGRRLGMVKLENTIENRRLYRQLVLSRGNDLQEFYGGILLSHEAMQQSFDDGKSFVSGIQKSGIHVGIKVNAGSASLDGANGTAAKALTDLAGKLAKYKAEGADFTKWRSVLRVGVSDQAVDTTKQNSDLLAAFAKLSQEQKLVPILDIQILPDNYDILESTRLVAETVLANVIYSLANHSIIFEGALLRINILTQGSRCYKETPESIALCSVDALKRRVPPAMAGIFVSLGEKSEEEAFTILNLMNRTTDQPWPLSFCFSKSFHSTPMLAWKGKIENVSISQMDILDVSAALSLASVGKLTAKMKADIAAKHAAIIGSSGCQ